MTVLPNRIASTPALPAHGGQLRTIAQQLGIPADRLTDFSASINPDGPPASVLSVLQKALSDPATLGVYPDLEQTVLKQAIADSAAIPTDSISVANGFVPLLQAALAAVGVRRCLLPVPAFGEYRRSLEQAGIAVAAYPLEPSGFRYHPAAMLAAMLAPGLTPGRTPGAPACDAILLANPQNPSGALSSAAELLAFTREAAVHGITVLLDEAFIDYTPAESLIRHAPALPNLILFRSVTKFFAMPGLRIAYAVSHAVRTGEIAHALPPWPVTTLAALAVCATLADHAYAEQSQYRNTIRRTLLQQQLELQGLAVYPSAANFLLLRLPAHMQAATLRDTLIQHQHIVVRACDTFEGLSPNHLRVAVRSQHDNTRLAKALSV